MNYSIKMGVIFSLISSLLLSSLGVGSHEINSLIDAHGQVSKTSNLCLKLPIINARGSSSEDGHVPANVLDNNLDTRWSSLGIGSFIQVDLGGQKTICSVDIAWYRGTLRQNNFVISVSNDSNTFRDVFTGKSSGTTLFAEKYKLPTSIEARYVRVTVNGNTENNWASITELTVDGFNTVPHNTHPTADNLRIKTTSNTNVTITLPGTDPLPNDTLNFRVVDLPFNGNLSQGNSFNTVIYTPNHGFLGHDEFTYRAADGRGQVSNIGTVLITVSAPPPPPPTATNLKIQTSSNTNVTITLNGTDPIKGDRLKFTVVDPPINGELINGKTTDAVTYKPDKDFIGNDVFTYRSTDRLGVNSTIATVYIIVTAVPPPPPPPPQKPTANNLTISTDANTPIQITLNGTDPIPNDVLKFSVVTPPHHGMVSSPPNASSTVIYTPNTGYTGPDSFTYKVTTKDGGQGGVDSNIANVSITVNPVQPPPQKPTANNLTISTDANTPIQITLNGTDPIPNDVLKFSVVKLPHDGTLAPLSGSSSIVTYTPNPNFAGADNFTYIATDRQGVNSTIATVSITVNPVQPPPPPHKPTVSNLTTSTNANTSVQIILSGTPANPGDTLRFEVVTLPNHGKVVANSGSSSNVTYTPASGYSGPDSFTYRATDNHGVNSTIATVSITVNPVQPPPQQPTANNITVQTTMSSPVQITLNGTSPIPGDILKFSVVTKPQNGVVTNGTVSSDKFYTPNQGFTGTDSFTYKAIDGQGVSSNIATVKIIINSPSGGKILLAILREQFSNQSGLVNIFKPYLSTNDMVMTHPNANNLGFAFELSGMKGVEYTSLAEIEANAATLKAKGVSFISYDIENSLSPAGDTANPVASVNTAASIVHNAGLEFMVAPSRELTLQFASHFAAVADIYNAQGEGLQPTPSQYAAYYDNISPQIRAANPHIKIIAEVSTAQGSLQNMENSFSLVAKDVDGATSWYELNSLPQLNQFLSWLKNNFQ